MITRLLLGYTAAFVFALIPLVPHANALGVSLTGEATILGKGTSSSGASASVTTNTEGDGQEVSAEATLTPLTLTRADIRTEMAGVASTSMTTEFASNTHTSDPDTMLRTHALAALSADAKLSSVSLSPTHIALSYRVPAKLFGFIGISIPLQVSVDASGTTSVSYPWYGFILSSDKVGLAIRAEAAAKNQLASSTARTDGTLSADTQIHLLNSLTAVLESQSDAETSATL